MSQIGSKIIVKYFDIKPNDFIWRNGKKCQVLQISHKQCQICDVLKVSGFQYNLRWITLRKTRTYIIERMS